ncbi:MAG TPA: hypothetical protein VN831_26740 [Bradyrhizobium sp.]|nr:hypothetical protein [Bradyrhizobium sp.]
MTRLNTSFVLGYHGCHKAIGLQAVAGKLELIQSEKAYDWLGPGVYFWEGDPLRALEWAQWKKFDEPFVVGAVIDLRNCLDLMVKENLDLLASAYDSYVAQQRKSGLKILENKSPRGSKSEDDKKLRFLDCAVITHLHKILDNEQSAPSRDLPAMVQPFDSVRGLFEEKPEVYPGSGFFKNTHSQIAIRNLDCIVEIFVPRKFHSAA